MTKNKTEEKKHPPGFVWFEGFSNSDAAKVFGGVEDELAEIISKRFESFEKLMDEHIEGVVIEALKDYAAEADCQIREPGVVAVVFLDGASETIAEIKFDFIPELLEWVGEVAEDMLEDPDYYEKSLKHWLEWANRLGAAAETIRRLLTDEAKYKPKDKEK